mgnify:CR=1 FL=1|jgi:hypothetical protein
MHGGTVVTEEGEEKNVLNNDKPEINRGVELLLRNRRNVQPKTIFQLKFNFFKTEITFTINKTKK